MAAIPPVSKQLWGSHDPKGHVTLNLLARVGPQKFSPSRIEQQSHLGKGASDQINSFMELSDLIKLLDYILKLINGSIKPFCKWIFFWQCLYIYCSGRLWCQSK